MGGRGSREMGFNSSWRSECGCPELCVRLSFGLNEDDSLMPDIGFLGLGLDLRQIRRVLWERKQAYT